MGDETKQVTLAALMQESLHQAVHKKDPNRVPREGERGGSREDHVLCMRCYGYDGGVVLTRRRKIARTAYYRGSPANQRSLSHPL
ncbi:hypothetical protein CDEST_03032 [Colletotrichum destructivum]|uniref:Uncharacterized protein n=1 Tax=Colletotrichum destructivum TaxID=34406 RepID=A0AAX4I3P2_9PEZI|nr:hypothetical protein CDEST_03032 [Colletotrichum destructivum]